MRHGRAGASKRIDRRLPYHEVAARFHPGAGWYDGSMGVSLTDGQLWGLGAALAGVASLLLLWALGWDRPAKGRQRCPKCWYDMTHAAPDEPLRCPECGHRARKARQLRRIRRKWRWATLGFMIAAGAVYVLALPKARRDGWIVFVPDSVLILCIASNSDSWAAHALHERLFPTPPPQTAVMVLPAGQNAAIIPFGTLRPAAAPGPAQVAAPTVPPPPPTQRKPGALWSWQSRWLAWRTASTSLKHPRRWGTDVHDTLLANVPSPWDESAFGRLERAFERGDADLRAEAAIKMRRIVQDTENEMLRKRFVSLVHWSLKDSGPPPDETLIRVLDLPWREMREVAPFLIEQIQHEPIDGVRIAATRSLAEIAPHAPQAVEPLLAALPADRPDLPLYFLTLEAVLRNDPANAEALAIVRQYLEDRSIYIGYRVEASALWRFGVGEFAIVASFWGEITAEHPILAGEAAKQMAAWPRSADEVTALLQVMHDEGLGDARLVVPLLHQRKMLLPSQAEMVVQLQDGRNSSELQMVIDELAGRQASP